MNDLTIDILWIGGTVLLVVLNGFFVAAEFALVKLRGSRLQQLVAEGRPFARTTQWLARRMDRSLSACQLGITMASLGLGWVGEPAIADLLAPLLAAMGITAPALVHGIAFAVAFTIITAAHLVLGEQAPKIFALRRAETAALWCAVPLKLFYLLAFPLLVGLDGATSFLLRRAGIEGAGHDQPHSEAELRAIMSHAHTHGELTRSEHRLLEGVFEFGDLVCRQIMVPRGEVVFFDASEPAVEAVRLARRTRHTRYPVCDGSLDDVLGFVHVKDLVGIAEDADIDLRDFLRPPHFVPETLPIARLLGKLRARRQHLAFVIDEHGTTTGIVTMEAVLEQIVGELQDEFDTETPAIVPDGPGRHLVLGSTAIADVNDALGTDFHAPDVDTIAGLVLERLGRIPTQGDRVEVGDHVIEVAEVRGARAARVRVVKV